MGQHQWRKTSQHSYECKIQPLKQDDPQPLLEEPKAGPGQPWGMGLQETVWVYEEAWCNLPYNWKNRDLFPFWRLQLDYKAVQQAGKYGMLILAWC